MAKEMIAMLLAGGQGEHLLAHGCPDLDGANQHQSSQSLNRAYNGGNLILHCKSSIF